MIRIDRGGLDRLKKAAAGMMDASVEVGWWNDKSADGRITLPELAMILHDGATLKGGQPFLIFGDGRIAFLSRNSTMGRRIIEARARNGGVPVSPGRTRTRPIGADEIAATGITRPSTIPARPFFTITAEAKGRQWEREAGILARECLAGKRTWESILDLLGQIIKADVYEQMGLAENFAPNTPMTQARKKDGPKNTPLIDTNGLREALDYAVRTRGSR